MVGKPDFFSDNLLLFSILLLPISYVIEQIVKTLDLFFLAGIFFSARFYMDMLHLPKFSPALLLKSFYFFAVGIFIGRGAQYLFLNSFHFSGS